MDQKVVFPDFSRHVGRDVCSASLAIAGVGVSYLARIRRSLAFVCTCSRFVRDAVSGLVAQGCEL